MASQTALGKIIDRFISSTHPRAPLAGQGDMFVRVGTKYGVDPRLLVAIARKESEYGTKVGKYTNNAFGWGVKLGPSVYTSRTWEEGAEKVAKGLTGHLYKGSGLTRADQILPKYAPAFENNTALYRRQVNGWVTAMGGNPNASVFQAPNARAAETVPTSSNVNRTFQQAVVNTPGVAQTVDWKQLMAVLDRQKQRSLQGLMPDDSFTKQLMPFVQQFSAAAGANPPGAAQPPLRMPAGTQQPLTIGGRPGAGTHTLGNWQSDNAYDLMGKAGQQIVSPINGRVTRISGKPGGDPRFAGYGITIRTNDGKELFFKHIGATSLKVGQAVSAGTLIGTLEATTQGGPHLHLGGTHRSLLDRLAQFYTRATAQRGQATPATAGRGVTLTPGGGWGGTKNIADTLKNLGTRHGLTVSSSKRSRQNTKSGGRSDHWEGSKDSYAYDIWDGVSTPTAKKDAAANSVVQALGGPKDFWKRAGKYEVTKNGYRYQIIYRSDIGGNHYDHVHIGIRKV